MINCLTDLLGCFGKLPFVCRLRLLIFTRVDLEILNLITESLNIAGVDTIILLGTIRKEKMVKEGIYLRQELTVPLFPLPVLVFKALDLPFPFIQFCAE